MHTSSSINDIQSAVNAALYKYKTAYFAKRWAKRENLSWNVRMDMNLACTFAHIELSDLLNELKKLKAQAQACTVAPLPNVCQHGGTKLGNQ